MKFSRILCSVLAIGLLPLANASAQICVQYTAANYKLIQGERFTVTADIKGIPSDATIDISTGGGLFTTEDGTEVLLHADTGIMARVSANAASISIADRTIGVHQHKLLLKVMQSGAVIFSETKDVFYQVSKIVLSCALADNNVVYSGFPNAVYIAVSGVAPEYIRVSSSDGSLINNGGVYSLKTSRDSGTVVLHVLAVTPDGSIINCGSAKFQIQKMVPSVSLAWEGNKVASRIRVTVPIIAMSVKPAIVSWQMSVVSGKKVKVFIGTGDSLSVEAIQSLGKLKSGDKIILENVVVRMPDSTHKLNWLRIWD